MEREAQPKHHHRISIEDSAVLKDAEEDSAFLLRTEQNELHSRTLRRTVSRWTLSHEADDQESSGGFKHEAARIVQLALPLSGGQFASFALSLISVAFVGRLSEHELSIAIFATSMYNVTAIAVLVGFVGALETLAGQAFGARSYAACGVALQRSIVLSLLISAIVAGCWTQIKAFMLAIGQDPEIAAGASRYLHLAIPSMVATGVFESLKRYLNAQGIVHPAMLAALLAVACSPLTNWLLIFKLGLGIDGAVWAMNTCQVLELAVLVAYTLRHHRLLAGTEKQTWHGWSRAALAGWAGFLRLGLPSTVMVCLEWWAYEFMVILSGWLPNPAVSIAATGVALNLSGAFYMIPMGISTATSVRVSNALGAELPHAARRTALTAAVLTVCTQTAIAVGLAVGRGAWAAVFTNVQEVIQTAALIMPILAVTMFGDGMNATLGGMLRGAGRQELGALMMLTTFWVIGLPVAALLTFKAGWGVRGLWSGLCLATTIQGGAMLVVLSRFKWAEEARKARARYASEDGAVAGGSGEHGGAAGARSGSGVLEGWASSSQQVPLMDSQSTAVSEMAVIDGNSLPIASSSSDEETAALVPSMQPPSNAPGPALPLTSAMAADTALRDGVGRSPSYRD